MTDDAPYSVALNINAPPSPDYLLELADAVARIIRTMNHLTRQHEALQYPAEVCMVIGELKSAAGGFPQLLGQIGAWLEREQAAGRIEVAGDPDASSEAEVIAARINLDLASAAAEELRDALKAVASVTSALAAAEAQGDDDDE